MTESRIEKLTRIGQEMAAAVAEMNAEAVDLTPDLTTELATRQIEGEAAWWRSVDFDRNASRTFESMTGDSQQAVRTGVERVLAHLQSTGRLIPAGGMALTAEQVEDVRTYIDCAAKCGVGSDNGVAERLRALFPAIEPAKEAPADLSPTAAPIIGTTTHKSIAGTCNWCRRSISKHHAGTSWFHTESGNMYCTPAPAEPAKETAAEYVERTRRFQSTTLPAPAEPAEEPCTGNLWCEAPLHAEGCYATHRIPPGRLAPAVPAEEETKAEAWQEKVADLESQLEEEIANRDGWEQRLTSLIYSLATVNEVGEWTSSDDLDEKFIDHIGGKIQQLERALLAARGEGWYEGYEVGLEYGPIAASGEEYDGPINPYDVPVSSPVVPAPTETGPWTTWESVPDDVWFTSASAVGFLPAHRKRGSLVDWQFRDGSVGVYDVSRIGNGKLMARAPFVAAEEE